MSATARKPTNLTLDADLVSEARALNINVSRAAENGLEAAIRKERERRWLEENAEAIQSSNDWVEKNGLPVPAAKITTLPQSSCCSAFRRMNGSATFFISIADWTRQATPWCSSAPSIARAFITVASMPT